MSFLINSFKSWEVLGCGALPLYKLCILLTSKMIKKEIALGKIGPGDIVLNVGCGAIPFTAVNIVKHSGARVIAIDRDQDVLDKARYSLKKHGMGQNIELVKGEAAAINPPTFTVAIVALQAEPKVMIFDNLMRKSKKGARLIFRQPGEILKNHYDILPITLKPASEEAYGQGLNNIDKSLLYVNT